MQPFIRRAAAADGPAMHALTASVHPARIPEDLDGSRGFLLSLHTAETYSARAAASDLCFVAEAPTGSDAGLAGFLTAYPASLCSPWYSPDSGYGRAIRHAGPDCVMLDQIGVSPACRKLGVANLLYAAFAAACGPRPVVLDIAHAPVANRASLRFFRDQRGYRLIAEYLSSGLTFGLYLSSQP